MDAVEPDAELLRRDLRHLLKQALAHLRAAVIEVNRAVLIDVHQRAGLVEMRECEGDAEFYGRQRQCRVSRSASAR